VLWTPDEKGVMGSGEGGGKVVAKGQEVLDYLDQEHSQGTVKTMFQKAGGRTLGKWR